jgi:aspartyl aminopeptidase
MGASPVLQLLDFLTHATSPYHAARLVADRLRANGFIELDERADWELEPGQRAFVMRAGASVIAFQVGQKPPSEGGFLAIAAHTDSPNLRIKPKFEIRRDGVFEVAVEPYGGILLHTWLDRPLALAGRVVTGSGEVVLVDVPNDLLTIPSLAIHLDREVNKAGLALNPEQHLHALLGLGANGDSSHPLNEILATALGQALNQEHWFDPSQSAFDLCLLDATPAAFLGHNNAFIASGRIDNLVSTFAATQALLDTTEPTIATRVLVLFDHEEAGSGSFAGAQSTFLANVLTRVASHFAPKNANAAMRAFSASLLLSADMAHGVHPNYRDKHDDLHRPLLGQGPVLKTSSGQSYASDAVSSGALIRAAERAETPLQRFAIRNDLRCGSSLGPLVAARVGIRAVDAGIPMLAMHSCRELCATADVEPYIGLMREWYRTERIPGARY